jgi:uncharacterized membrane protein
MEEAPSHECYFITTWRKILQNFLRYIGVWKSVEDGYIPPQWVKSAAQKEAKRNNALALEITQNNTTDKNKNKRRLKRTQLMIKTRRTQSNLNSTKHK